MIFPAFFALVNPVSTIAKPACIKNTNAAPIKNQIPNTSVPTVSEICVMISCVPYTSEASPLPSRGLFHRIPHKIKNVSFLPLRMVFMLFRIKDTPLCQCSGILFTKEKGTLSSSPQSTYALCFVVYPLILQLSTQL